MARAQGSSQLGRDYFWNTAASGMISASSVIMTLLVTRFLGLEAAGLFTVAYAAGQLLQTLGMYEIRPFHVTDIDHRYEFGDYLASRFVTVGLMAGGITVYGLVSGNGAGTRATLMLVASLKLFEAFEDVFVSEFQRSGRLDLGARACFWRMLATTAAFAAGMLVTRSLLWGTVLAVVIALATTIGLYLPAIRGLFPLRPEWNSGRILRLLVDCLPLFLASFLAMYLAKAPNFAIDRYLDTTAQGYFANIFMPAMVINLLTLMVFRPLLTSMARHWAEGRTPEFLGVVRKGLVTTLVASLVAGAAAFAIGVPALNLVTGADFSNYRTELMVLIAGGAMNAVSVILYYAMATMRFQRLIFAGYLMAAAAVTGLCVVLVPAWGLLGACVAYSAAMTVLSAFFAVPVLTAHRQGATARPGH
ncbi:lipopolysaccharide biosynthesis protein [uncultured Actinomyces sp.]|uniref:lipopolysaccharide biosynthesis protein n=1 Tax=uncultured Actinomyces sp. TaxID=249061 RepID=UPI00288AC69B|nr:lipopolysaccharide biosynthesis protein [uncultured Actinomyces sp.]